MFSCEGVISQKEKQCYESVFPVVNLFRIQLIFLFCFGVNSISNEIGMETIPFEIHVLLSRNHDSEGKTVLRICISSRQLILDTCNLVYFGA